MHYIIRPAKLIDMTELRPLLVQLGYPCSAVELTRRLNNYINDEYYGVVVAVSDQVIIGCLAWSRNKLFLSDRQRLHVEALVVSETHRGQGIGSQLLEYLENLTIKLAPALITVTSGVHRASNGTHKFYENRGYNSSGPQAKIYFIKEFSKKLSPAK